MAWSRIYDDQEVLVVVNPHGVERRGARVIIDGNLSAEGMLVVVNSDATAPATMQPGARVEHATWNGCSCVCLDQWLLGPSEVLVLANHSAIRAVGLDVALSRERGGQQKGAYGCGKTARTLT